MAIDSRIALMGKAPNIGQSINIFENALMNAQTRDIRQQQEARAAELAPLHKAALEQGVKSGQQRIDNENTNRIIKSIAEFAPQIKPALQSAIETGETAEAQTILSNRLNQLQQQGLPTQETADAITMLRNGNVQGVLQAVEVAENQAITRGLSGAQKSVGQRDFETKVNLVKADPKLKTPAAKAAAIDLGLEARASSSAQERIAQDPELTTAVAKSQAEISGETESAKLQKQLKHKPAITKAVKMAEKQASERGEVLTDLARMEASLPGLKEAVGELLELSDIATSTLGGKAFDFLVKESGFGSTKGANARAKLIAIVDNQVLPLLKETFGAAFTVQEGENLKASLVDPNASPEQKRQQLSAFLAQKERNIRTKQAQLSEAFEAGASFGQGEAVGAIASEGKIMIDANGNRARVFADGTFEEL